MHLLAAEDRRNRSRLLVRMRVLLAHVVCRLCLLAGRHAKCSGGGGRGAGAGRGGEDGEYFLAQSILTNGAGLYLSSIGELRALRPTT